MQSSSTRIQKHLIFLTIVIIHFKLKQSPFYSSLPKLVESNKISEKLITVGVTTYYILFKPTNKGEPILHKKTITKFFILFLQIHFFGLFDPFFLYKFRWLLISLMSTWIF